MMNPTALGTVFEKQVEEELLRLGFDTWRDLYIPTDEGFTQVDIVAMRPGQLWVVECKNWSGTLNLETWVRTTETGERRENNFFRQNTWHGIVLRSYLHMPYYNIVVVNNGLNLVGLPEGKIYHLRELADVVSYSTAKFMTNEHDIVKAMRLLDEWSEDNEEKRRQHRTRLQDKYNPPEVLILP